MTPAFDSKLLSEVLEGIFGRRLASLRRSVSAYSSSCTIEDLELRFTDGGSLPVVFKNLSPEAVVDRARGVRPEFVIDPCREIEVYGSILSKFQSGAARYYGSDAKRHWLFLESVRAPMLCHIGDFESWLEVARWLARFHSSLTASAHSARKAVSRLLEYDAVFYRRWVQRARLELPYEHILRTLLALPTTLVHGDFYASNVLVGDGRICPIDWELAAIGPGLLDLAALTSGKWSRERRLELAEAYISALPDELRPSEWVFAYDCCQFQIAVQWLGWAEGWTPPQEHSHDWFAEIRSLPGIF
jgi:hypothetical protein